MGILDFLSKQFVDVIDWTEEPGQLGWRFPVADREIQTGAQLTVREGQTAAFFDEGKIADAFGPGLYTLDTGNLPLLTSLQNWSKGFNSPFKSDVCFFSHKEQTGLKWGTAQPVTIRDPELGALRVRAFGSYSFRIGDMVTFAARILGTLPEVRVADIEPQLRAAILTAMATGVAGSGTPFLDLAANQTLLSETLKKAVAPSFAEWGIEIRTLFVESLSLPEEVQKHLDKTSSMRLIGDLDRYAKFQATEAMESAAGQSGGIAGIGAGAAAGMAISQAMAGSMTPAAQPAPAPAAAAPAAPAEDPFVLIGNLHKLLTAGAISQAEFDAKKTELLGRVK